MAKVVTSEGLQDYISTGKPTETIANDATSKKLALAEKLEAVDNPQPKTDPPPQAPSNVVELSDLSKKEAENAEPQLTDEDKEELKGIPLSPEAQKRLDKWFAKRTKIAKTAQEEAQKAREEAESDQRLAESLFNERELWRQKAEAAEKRVQQPPPTPEPVPELKEPSESDPKYWDDKKNFKLKEFVADSVNYKAEADRRQAEADRRREQLAKNKEESERIDKAFEERVTKARTEKYKDWDEKVPKLDVQLPFGVLDYIRRSPYGDDLAYYLATHREVAQSIRDMHFTLGIGELRDIEATFKKPATKAVAETLTTTAVKTPPEPITPISTSGTGTIQLDPAKMSFKELRAYERERARNKR